MNSSHYDPKATAQYFDEFGEGEWRRLTATPVDEVSLHLHTHYLKQHVRAGMRVLEIGAGAGRFTRELARSGARVVVADLSPVQLALNQKHARRYRFVRGVERWDLADICDLSAYPDESFDAVVAYGGPFSYVLDRRDAALAECLRVLRARGPLLLSVMSLWGTAHWALKGVLDVPPAQNQRITASGDLIPENLARRGNACTCFVQASCAPGWSPPGWTCWSCRLRFACPAAGMRR